MRVFLSWSGEMSRAVALALKDWLPKVVQAAKPWMSARDIAAGARWSEEIAAELKQSRFGIVVLTPENRSAPWLHFEAGAISKEVAESQLVPYLVGLDETNLVGLGPLGQFQAKRCDRAQTRELVNAINSALGEPLAIGHLDDVFAAMWPALEAQIAAAVQRPSKAVVKPSADEILEEILATVKALARPQPSRQRSRKRRIDPIPLIDRAALLEMNVRRFKSLPADICRREAELREKETHFEKNPNAQTASGIPPQGVLDSMRSNLAITKWDLVKTTHWLLTNAPSEIVEELGITPDSLPTYMRPPEVTTSTTR